MDSFCIGITKHSNFTVDIPAFTPFLEDMIDLVTHTAGAEVPRLPVGTKPAVSTREAGEHAVRHTVV